MPLPNLIAGGLFSLGEEIVKRVWPDPADQQKAMLELKKMEQAGDLAQMAVNMKEAEHESIFVSGWRPAIGWICGLALFHNYFIHPSALFLAALTNHDMSALPEVDMAVMMPVLLGMLGLGWLRTQEKKDGVNKNR